MSTLKYLRAMIKLGNLGLEVFQAPDGSYRLSQTQVLQAIDVSKNWISRLQSDTPNTLKSLQSNGFRGYSEDVFISSESKARKAKTFSIDDSVLIWIHCSMKGNPKAIFLLEQIRESDDLIFSPYKNIVIPNNKKVKSLKRKENYYSDLLAATLKGCREVETESGRIDVLTSTEVIEVKTVKDWKGAIGQVLIYGSYYPDHQKRIHLFGESNPSFKAMVERHCSRLNIFVTWEPMEAVSFAVQSAGIKPNHPIAKDIAINE